MPDTGARTRGFRFSPMDAAVLVAGAALTWALWRPMGQFALLVPVTLGHFFLFCNVFRVGNGRELLWTAAFVANFTAWAIMGEFSWLGVLAVQAPVTLGIVLAAVRSPRYRGVFSRPNPATTTPVEEVAR